MRCTLAAEGWEPSVVQDVCYFSISYKRRWQVWDFDWSLVEENSDTWVLQRLGATAAYERLRAQVSSRPPAGVVSNNEHRLAFDVGLLACTVQEGLQACGSLMLMRAACSPTSVQAIPQQG